MPSRNVAGCGRCENSFTHCSMWLCRDMSYEWPIMLCHRVTLLRHARYVNWHALSHYMVVLGHNRKEWAGLHHQMVALDLAGMQSQHQLWCWDTARAKNGLIHAATWWWHSQHTFKQVCLSHHVSAVGHGRYTSMPASPGGSVGTQQVCE